MEQNNIDLGNYFLEKNGEYLEKICRENLPQNCKVLEIGSWKGKSSSIIAKIVKERSGILYCIDTWEGSEDEEEMVQLAKSNDIFNIFKSNLIRLNLYDVVVPIVADSRIVKEIFPDDFFDMIFIDGNHKYDFVTADLNNYLPKLKDGGTICGDDCEDFATNLPLNDVRINRNNDWTIINNKGYHCGVLYALYEVFGNDYNIGPGSTFWWKKVKEIKSSSQLHPVDINLVFANSHIDYYNKSNLFVPLDVKALKTISDSQLSFKYLEDLLGINSLIRIKNLAYEYNLNWFKITQTNIEFLNIAIPEIDLEYLRWFWYQLLIIEELRKIGTENSYNYIFEPKKFRPAEYYYPNSLLEDKFSRKKSNPKFFQNSKIYNLEQYASLRNKFVFVLNPGEFIRFESIIIHLNNDLKNDFIILLINSDAKVEDKLRNKYDINYLVFKNVSNNISLDVFKKYYNEFLINAANTPLARLIEGVEQHFEYIFLNRFPNIYKTALNWYNIFSSFKPKAVLGSRLPDSENRLPISIASKLEIITFSIPHGVTSERPYYIHKSNTHILSSHLEEVEQFIQADWSNDYVHYVSGLELSQEYQHKQLNFVKNDRKHRILILVNPCAFDNILYQTISFTSQLKAIRQINKFVNSSSNYEVFFKAHPYFHNKELFELDDASIKEQLLPINSSLEDILPNIDLVIGLNYSAAAIIHSINKRKPIILCWNDKLYLETKLDHSNLISSACDICYSIDDMIDLIYKYFNNLDYNNHLNLKINQYMDNKNKNYNKLDFIWQIKLILKTYNTEHIVSGKDLGEPKSNVNSSENIIVSIIIPTFNRAKCLISAILSIYKYNRNQNHLFEVIVVDNGSNDNTALLCNEISKKANNFKYIYEHTHGLLSARHAGANVAIGNILTFIDDDIEITNNWLSSIIEIFENKNVHLAGGPTLPIFESAPPEWMKYYCYDYNINKGTGYLSLLNRDDNDSFIDPNLIWGLNFSIRKSVFYDCGGFNPDNINKEIQYFQGDGETGLAIKIKNKNYNAYYSKNISVYHNIFNNRLTPQYFEDRAFYQGICDSYTQIRQKKSINKIIFPKKHIINIPSEFKQYENIYNDIYKHYLYGFYYHQYALVKSHIVHEWTLKEDYFDYTLPTVSQSFHNEMLQIRNNLYLLDDVIYKS